MLQGIDIYSLNLNDPQAPSWAAIRQAGFSFVFQKANEYQQDSSFARRWPEFRANGLLRGAYYLPRPDTDNGFVKIDGQLDTYLQLCPRLLPGDFGPILDLEDRLLFPDDTKAQHNAGYWVSAAQRLLARMETALGRQPIIYTQRSWWTSYMNGAVGFDQYLLWVVDINHSTAPVLPASWSTWTWWQWHWEHSSSPMPPPFRQPTDVGVDLDYFNGTTYELRGLADIGRPGVAFLGGSPAIAHSELDDHLHVLTAVGTAWTDSDLGQGALPGGGADPVLLESAGALVLYFRSGDAVIEAMATAATSWVWQATDLTLASTVKPVHDPRAVIDGDKRYVAYWGDDDWHLLTYDGGWSSVGVLRDAHLGASSGPPAVYVRDGLPHVAGRIDADGHLWEVWPDLAGGWKAEDATGAAIAIDPATPAATYTPCACQTSGGLLLAFRAVGGELWLIDRTNNAPTNLTAAAGAVRGVGHPTSFVLNDVPHIVYRGIDGVIYELSRAGAGWQTQAICPDKMAADPVATTDGTNAAVAVRAPDGMIHLATFDGSAWACGATAMAAPTQPGTPAPDDGGAGNPVA